MRFALAVAFALTTVRCLIRRPHPDPQIRMVDTGILWAVFVIICAGFLMEISA